MSFLYRRVATTGPPANSDIIKGVVTVNLIALSMVAAIALYLFMRDFSKLTICFFLPHRFFEMSNLPKRRRRLKPSLAVVYKAYGMEREKVKRRTILEKARKKARS